MLLADKLGYDGLVLNRPQHPVLHEPGAEHHGGGAHPADQGPDQRVRHLPNFEYPNRLAEEYAMLDVMSGGRLVRVRSAPAWSTGRTQ